MIADSDGGSLKDFYILNEPHLPDISKRTPGAIRIKAPFIFLEAIILTEEV
jgi:hypothetical protein